MRASKAVILGAACMLLVSGAALAQGSNHANAPTVTGETGFFSLLSGRTLPGGRGSFGLYYNNWDRVLNDAGESDVDWNRLSASFGYGITDNFEIVVMVPYEDLDFDLDPDAFEVDREIFGDEFFDDTRSGLGNARLGVNWGINSDVDSAFSINAWAELPTGDEDVLGGDTGFGAGINYGTGNWAFNLHYRAPGDVDADDFLDIDDPIGLPPGELPRFGDLELSDEIIAGLGYAGQVSDRFDWITELVGTLPTDSDEAFYEESVDLTTGGRWWFGDDGGWALSFGLRTDLLQLEDTDEHCPIGGLLGLTFFPGLFVEEEVEEIPPVPIDYMLTVEKEGDCDGTVTSSPAGVDCGADCSELYAEGTVVTLTATPEAECRFTGWTGDADCSDGTVTMNGDRLCVANFQEVAAPPPPPPPPPPEERVEERVCYFAPGSARVDNACKAILDEVALLMQDRPEATGVVIGYSDEAGSEESNQAISLQRAENVKNWLVTRHGIDPSRITVEGRGEAEATGDANRDRRAVIQITIVE
ncbi:MAG TPA: OmpA family protein [Thermoanaerobaculia bacterium]|nr:OmpA family protein [Thermoanaerobaculia bacterium]